LAAFNPVLSGFAPDPDRRHKSALASGVVVRHGEHIAEGGYSPDMDRPSTGLRHVLLAPSGWSEEVAHLIVGQA